MGGDPLKPYYEQNGITIYHGDCREVLPNLSPQSIDLVLTDPPYAAAAATVTTGFAKTKWGGNWGDMSLVTLNASQVFGQQFLASQHQVYWFCDHLSYAALVPYVFSKYPLIQCIVWDKDILGVGSCYRKQTEFILYCRTQAAPPLPKDRRDLIRMRPCYSEKQHPCAKPVDLVKHLAEGSTWETLLDPFMGSGTSLVVAQLLGRKAVGIEIEERYCEIAVKRLQREVLFKEAMR